MWAIRGFDFQGSTLPHAGSAALRYDTEGPWPSGRWAFSLSKFMRPGFSSARAFANTTSAPSGHLRLNPSSQASHPPMPVTRLTVQVHHGDDAEFHPIASTRLRMAADSEAMRPITAPQSPTGFRNTAKGWRAATMIATLFRRD